MKKTPSQKRAISIFKANNGMLNTSKAIKAGINPKTLYELRDKGIIVQISRGIYRLSEKEELSNPDITIAALKIPKGVICLISALSFHNITTQIPHKVDIALPQNTHKPRLTFPPIRAFYFSGNHFTEGIEIHEIDGVEVKVYNPAKTIVDCFKFRNKIGIDIAVEALKMAYREKKVKPAEIIKYAKICRVEKIIMPYLETIL